jgi:hypothetical protein
VFGLVVVGEVLHPIMIMEKIRTMAKRIDTFFIKTTSYPVNICLLFKFFISCDKLEAYFAAFSPAIRPE